MIKNLIKDCQLSENFKSCKECGCDCDDEYNTFYCLQELITQYNEKYHVNYKLIDFDRFIKKVKEILNEC